MMVKRIHIKVGDQYGSLTVIDEAAPVRYSGTPYRQFLCKCECGNERTVRLGYLQAGAVVSCGCGHSRLLTYKGETLHMAEWAKRLEVSFQVLARRLDVYGYTVEEALTLPIGARRTHD